jgi:galactokinase
MAMHELKSLFQKQFNELPRHIVQAPGRVELLGNHTDYNEGLVMSLAVDRYVYMAVSPRPDGRVELVSTSFPQREGFFIDKIEKNPEAPWANYVKGVLLQLRKAGVHFTGFSAAIHGTIPFGAGLSSSAALEVATALAVRELFPFAFDQGGLSTPPARQSNNVLPSLRATEKMAIAKICQAAESRFVGVNSGLLDQISSIYGKANHVIQIDCQRNTVAHDPMPPGVAVVVCDSCVKHDLSAGEYNELRRHCESAAKTLGVPALRYIDPERLEAEKAKLSPRDYECARHIVGENHRVVFGERALREGDIDQFGQYLFQSHASSRDFFKNSTKELDELVEIASRQPGCYGARLTGGGFGGATINLVRADSVEVFRHNVAAEYARRGGPKTEPWVCKVVDGARAL